MLAGHHINHSHRRPSACHRRVRDLFWQARCRVHVISRDATLNRDWCQSFDNFSCQTLHHSMAMFSWVLNNFSELSQPLYGRTCRDVLLSQLHWEGFLSCMSFLGFLTSDDSSMFLSLSSFITEGEKKIFFEVNKRDIRVSVCNPFPSLHLVAARPWKHNY